MGRQATEFARLGTDGDLHNQTVMSKSAFAPDRHLCGACQAGSIESGGGSTDAAGPENSVDGAPVTNFGTFQDVFTWQPIDLD
jgi:hypothetical protein